jgi:nuclear transport factor 2 (NTF2) superfamily protein
MADLQKAALAGEVATANDAVKNALLYAPDATLRAAGYPEAKGRDAIQALNQGFLDANSNFNLTYTRTWSKGNMILAEWVINATDKKTGKPWGVDGVDLITLNDDGLITNQHSYWDDVTILKQLGAYKDERPFRPIPTAPTGGIEAHVSKGDATEDANVANQTSFEAAWVKADDKTALALFADGYKGNSYTGWETKDKKWVVDGAAQAKKAYKDRAWKSWQLFGVEDFTIEEGESTITQAGAFVHGPIKVPNKHKTVTGHHLEVDQWKDGKIIAEWSWSNGTEVDKQLEIRTAAPKPADKKTAAAKK